MSEQAHTIISVYFPDKELITEINLHLINNMSISSFIVHAIEQQLKNMSIGDHARDCQTMSNLRPSTAIERTEQNNNK